MLLAQAAAGAGAVSRRPRVARGGTAALLLLALVSGISGFFDGQLARPDLGAAYVAMQWVYVVVAAAVVVLAGRRLRELRRSRPVGATAA